MTYLLRLSACLFVLLSFNAKALVVNGCTIEVGTICYGGEGGIRTLGTLPYTHFPGVLFRPLRHLTENV